MVIEVQANRMPGGGLVTFSDVTPSFEAPRRWSAPMRRWKSACGSHRELTRGNSNSLLQERGGRQHFQNALAAAGHDIRSPHAARLS